MTTTPRTTELDARYSSPGATPVAWPRTEELLRDAAIFWLSTVRSDGGPHVTPVIAVWTGDAVHFCTGPEEQKAKNLAANPNVVVTTGTNTWTAIDVVVEGEAAPVTDEDRLRDLAAAWEAKYGADWHFDVADGAFRHEGGRADVFAVSPTKIYTYERAEPGGATRYRF